MTHTDSSRMPLSSRLLLSGTTALALAFMAPQVFAQNVPGEELSDVGEEDVDEVVATGIRQALKAARDLKRDADTAVDSITASDVSTLPDLSVAEALARIPGVVVQRIGLGGSNGDFPSPEGGGNLIRGLTLVRSELNGRDAFSANQGRALDFGTVPPELIGAVDVYKNTSADLIEGGIGGSINLRTLEPFDRPGRIAVATIDGTYTDLREKISPEASIILGNRWDMNNGAEFGLLGSLSHSELKSELHGFQIGQVVPFPVGTEFIGLPGGFQLRTNEVNRERDSYYIASQYRNADNTLEITAKYARIENEIDSDERTAEFFPQGENYNTYTIDGLTTTPFTSAGIPRCQGEVPAGTNPLACEVTDPINGLYESGVISNRLRDWTGIDNQNFGAEFSSLGINQQDESMTDDLSLNIKFRPADNVFVNLDGHHSTAEFSRTRLWAGNRFFSDFTLNADLDNPMVEFIPRAVSTPRDEFLLGNPGPQTSNSLADPRNSYLLFAADEFADNEGDLYALSGDVEYEFENDGWFDSVKFGARFSEREQTNRQAGLNWAVVAAPWAGGYYPASASPFDPEAVEFSDFFRGGLVTGEETTLLFANRYLLQNYDSFVATIANDPNLEGIGGVWEPLRGSDGVVDYANEGTTGLINEKVYNAYARFDFGNEFDNGMSVDANIGLRYTRSETDGVGSINYIDINSDAEGFVPDPENPTVDLNEFVPEAVAFSQQDNVPLVGPFSTDERWLPSLNVKLNLNDEMLIRLGASKNITRPTLGQLSPNQSRVPVLSYIVDRTDPDNQTVTDVVVTGVNTSGSNPYLEPILSDNIDLSYEWYFGGDSSFTLSGFYKKIENNILSETTTTGTETLDGNTVAANYVGLLNQDDAEILGVEAAYQQFYDFLPGLLGNLGLQMNYTYIDAKTSPPGAFVDSAGNGVPQDFLRVYRFGIENFLGLSEHSASVVGIYQSDALEFRLAYNWRSEYLSSYRDYVTGNPIFQSPKGYLDASFKWDMSDVLQFRVQAANILDTKANSEQQIDASGQRFGRTSFLGDRRIKVGFRAQF